MTVQLADAPVGILVAERASRADVLDTFGIDYCCGGKLSIRWFCDKKGLDLAAVLAALDASDRAPAPAAETDWRSAPLAELIAHVVGTHHAYLHATLPRLGELMAAVVAAHGGAQPELAELARLYARFRAGMEAHMAQEEQVVFPLIVRLERGLSDKALGERFLAQQLARMEAEHHDAGHDLDALARLTQGFTAPEGACESQRALGRGLSEVFADTHRHVHLENTLLFPRAARLAGLSSPRRAGAANRGEIVFAEKHPANPLRDEATARISHRGGLTSARAQLY